jgi:hypothetical protein
MEKTRGKKSRATVPLKQCINHGQLRYAAVFIYIFFIYGKRNYISIYTCYYFKQKTAQAILLDPFTICSLCKLCLSFVRVLTKKQTEVIRLQTD